LSNLLFRKSLHFNFKWGIFYNIESINKTYDFKEDLTPYSTETILFKLKVFFLRAFLIF
jgi:hypothetical protein